LAHRLRGTDNFLKHRGAIDFLSQNEVLIPEPLLRPLLVVDVGCRHVPADDLAAFVFEGVVLNELPAILPALKQGAHFQLERKSLQQSHPTLLAHPVYIVRMEDTRKEAFLVHLADSESSAIQRHPIRVECGAIRRQHHDRLTNGIRDCAQVALSFPKFLFRVLPVIYVGIDAIPADEIALLIVGRRRRDLEPAILSVKATKAEFCLPSIPRILETLPPLFELFHVVPVKYRLPLFANLVRRKAAIILKSLVNKFRDAVGTTGPGKCWYAIDKSAEFQIPALGVTRFHS